MWIALLTVCLTALLLNIPLGIWREHCRKFSVRWFVAVHASIPLIIALRLLFGLSAWYIPLTIGLAVLGQFIGGGLVKRGRIVIGTWAKQKRLPS